DEPEEEQDDPHARLGHGPEAAVGQVVPARRWSRYRGGGDFRSQLEGLHARATATGCSTRPCGPRPPPSPAAGCTRGSPPPPLPPRGSTLPPSSAPPPSS